MNHAKAKTYWTMTLRGPDGRVKHQSGPWPNKMTKAGIDALHACCLPSSGARPALFQYLAIGTSTVDPTDAQTALLNEVARLPADTYDHTAGTTLTTLRASFGPGVGTGSITEYGLFNASSGGTMCARVLDAVTSKGPLDTLDVECQFTLQEAEE